MSKKVKNILSVSIALNILLLFVVVWGFFQMNYVTERTLFNEVKINFMNLEDAISHQKENNWSQPGLVTKSVEEVINGLLTSMNIGTESRTLSKNDIELLRNLEGSLWRYLPYPRDTLDSFIEISDEDKEHYEELGEKLQEVGFSREQIQKDIDQGIHRGTFDHIDSILGQVEALEANLDCIW